MLFQLVLTKFFKSELFSSLQNVDHVINQCKRPIALSTWSRFYTVIHLCDNETKCLIRLLLAKSLQTQTSLIVFLGRGSLIWTFHLSLTCLSTSCLRLLLHESTFHFHAILNAAPSKLGHFRITGTGAWSLSCNGSGHLGTHRWRGWNGDRNSGRAMTLYTWEQSIANKRERWNDACNIASGVQYSDSGVQYRDDTTTDKISHPNFDHNLIWNERNKFQSIINSCFYFRLCFDPRWPHVRKMTRLPSNWSLWEQQNCL